METVIFWLLWGIISFWSLKTFYYSFSKEKINRLRKAALGINLALVVLMFLPWLPVTVGGGTAITLALGGEILAVLFGSLVLVSSALFLAKDSFLLKSASVATIANTFVLFTLMIKLRPETFTLTLFDIAPIISILLLLVGDVAVLLLWQQLQLSRSKRSK